MKLLSKSILLLCIGLIAAVLIAVILQWLALVPLAIMILFILLRIASQTRHIARQFHVNSWLAMQYVSMWMVMNIAQIFGFVFGVLNRPINLTIL